LPAFETALEKQLHAQTNSQHRCASISDASQRFQQASLTDEIADGPERAYPRKDQELAFLELLRSRHQNGFVAQVAQGIADAVEVGKGGLYEVYSGGRHFVAGETRLAIEF
jgi:hypothetical protein